MAGQAIRYLYKRARELGYNVEIIDEKKRVVKVSKDGKSRYVYKRSLPLNTTTSTKITKNKLLTSKILESEGFRTPKGFAVNSLEDALTHIVNRDLSFPVVIKPNDKSLGLGVYTNIETKEELETLLMQVFEKYKSVLMEEYFPWEDYRLLVLDGEVIAAAKRVPPFIIGDGKSTIKELIREFNSQKSGNRVLIGKELKRQLTKAHLDLMSVLPDGAKFILRGNANIQTGGLVEDMTDEIPKFFKEIAVTVAKTLGLRFTGVDIMLPNLEGKEYVIIEVNGLPSFDIHLIPTKGKIQDPSEKIWKAVFKE